MSRWTFCIRLMIKTPMENKTVKTIPKEASSWTRPEAFNRSIRYGVRTPTTTAPNMTSHEFNVPVIQAATAMPGSTAWLMASPIKAIFRSTKKQPMIPAAPHANAPINMIQRA